jgi:hypothetical protein
MSESLKRFVTSIRSIFSSPEDKDPLLKMPDLEPEEGEESEELTLADAAVYEIEHKVES